MTLNAWGIEAKEGYWGGVDEHPNPSYAPEECGLKTIAEIEYSDECYQFDTRIVWKHLESGRYYTARDSGCSCPTPFEGYRQLSDLEDFDYDAIKREVNEERGKEYTVYVSSEDAQTFLNKIRRLKQPR